MLSFLQIRNYAIVDNLDLDFASGFTCITGETGAGKSILVGALGLLCGNRADTAAIRSGSGRAELTAEFGLPECSPALMWLQQTELDDGRHCLVRRTMSESGRSRAWINGTPVTLTQLAELGELLVEIHGQNEHLRLTRTDDQYRLLDGAGTYQEELEALRERHESWQRLDRERSALLAETPLDGGEFDLLQYQINELEQSMLPAEQFLALEKEHRKLASGSEVVAALELALQNLEKDPGGVIQGINHSQDALAANADLDEEISAALGLLREASINCEEAQRSLQSARSRLDLSPERLAEVERQLSTQHDLARKHRVEPDRLAGVLESLQSRCERAGSLEKRLEAIDSEIAVALKAYREAAQAVHDERSRRAEALANAVTDLMQELGMEGGRLEFVVAHETDGKPSIRGNDRLQLNVSANPGTPPGPLRKVASGGELSRISLAIKVAARSGAVAATQVFDEVDAGIGGETANAVGALLRSLASGGQALCVTHLAQVAVFADQQLQVLKSAGELDTRVETSLLDEKERIDEIARMLGGTLAEQSRAHAAELLTTAATRH
jgi:DNA repair protein RecN (Recombination protein N)